MKSEGFPIQVATPACRVPVSDFYGWQDRLSSLRAIRHPWMTDQIIETHTMARGTYGSRRVDAEFTLGRQVNVANHASSLEPLRRIVSQAWLLVCGIDAGLAFRIGVGACGVPPFGGHGLEVAEHVGR